MKKKTEENVRKLERALRGDPMGYAALWKASELTIGEFKNALIRNALKNGRVKEDRGLYYIPGQERLAREKAEIGGIGNRQKLVLVKEAFHEIFMLRLMDYDHNGSWKKARIVAERIEPLMQMVKDKDPQFPYSEKNHQALEDSPGALIPELEAPFKNWQKYCADVMDYCDRRLNDFSQ